MKKIGGMFILLIVTFSLMGIEIYVDGHNTQGPWNGTMQYPWRYIQQAVNVASSGDVIIIYDGTYTEDVDLDEFTTGTLTIQSTYPTNPSVVESTIVQADRNNAFLRTDDNNSASFYFNGLTIANSTAGIRIWDVDYSTPIYVNNCIFYNNSFGILSESIYVITAEDCIFYDNSQAAIISTHNWVANEMSINVFRCLIYGNGDGLVTDVDIYIENCTIVDNNLNGLTLASGNSVGSIKSSIIYDNNTQIAGNGTATVTYSCIEGGHPGTGNIDSDPLFEDAVNNNYSLKWTEDEKSPCINTGNLYTTDPDGTRSDMGALYHHCDLKSYEFSGPYTLPHAGWTWLCFDVLDPTNAATYNQVQYLLEPIRDNLDYGEHENTTFNYTSPPPTWNNGTELVTSPKGYKIKMTDDDEFEVAGFRCPADTEFDIYEGEDNWIGYFLEDTQQVYDAFGSHHLDNIFSIQHQDWSIDSSRGWPDVSYTLSPGDMVIVKCDSDIESFVWQDPSRSRTEPFVVLYPELFTYTEQADYLPIYVELDENDLPDEIAVFVDDECKGARVVQHPLENICAYITDLQSGSVEIEFAYYGREANKRHNKYTIIDPATGNREDSTIDLSEKSRLYYISFRSGGENSSDLPVMMTASNYPNPFNPSTVISYDLPQESKISISIYNLKGQKVKELINGSQPAGSFSVEWNGEDLHGKQVSSGIYYYRLEACGRTLHKKMLMLK